MKSGQSPLTKHIPDMQQLAERAARHGLSRERDATIGHLVEEQLKAC